MKIRNNSQTPEYDSTQQAYCFPYDVDEATDVVSIAILALANVTNVEPNEMTPLYDNVDPDALNQAIQLRDNDAVSIGDITFIHHDHKVTVTDEGTILIRPTRRHEPDE